MSLHYHVKHGLPKNQRNSPCSKKPSRYIRHYIMANCHFIAQYIINNSLKQWITTFCCQISWQILVAYRCVLCNMTMTQDWFGMSPFLLTNFLCWFDNLLAYTCIKFCWDWLASGQWPCYDKKALACFLEHGKFRSFFVRVSQATYVRCGGMST